MLAAVALWLVPPEYRALRIGAVLYALLALAVFVIPNPLGGNVTRLGALFAGPGAGARALAARALVVLAVSLPLLYWQLIAPVRDVRKADGDPSTERAFYEPLLAELDRLAAPRARSGSRSRRPRTAGRPTTSPATTRSPAAGCASSSPTTSTCSPTGRLTAGRLPRWLRDHAVTYVAVPDAPRDYLAEDEVALIDVRARLPRAGLERRDWRLYRVGGAAAMGPATALGVERRSAPTGSRSSRAGRSRLDRPVNWTPLWGVTSRRRLRERGRRRRHRGRAATGAVGRSRSRPSLGGGGRIVLGIVLGARLAASPGAIVRLPRRPAEPPRSRALSVLLVSQPVGLVLALAVALIVGGSSLSGRDAAARRCSPGRSSCSRSAPSTARWRSARSASWRRSARSG